MQSVQQRGVLPVAPDRPGFTGWRIIRCGAWIRLRREWRVCCSIA